MSVGSEKWLRLLAAGLAGFLIHCGGDSTSSGTSGPPGIGISGATATFSLAVGGPAPPTQSFAVTNSGSGTLNGLNTTVTYAAGQPTGWLTATLTTPIAPSMLRLSVAAASLPPGTYAAVAGLTSGAAANSPQTVSVTFTVAACPAATTLLVGEDIAIDPLPTLGCVVFPQNGSGTDSAEYLLVPQAATVTPDLSATFWLAGGSAPTPAGVLAVRSQPTEPSPATQFHDLLRELERTRAYVSSSHGQVAPHLMAPAMALVDTVGSRRTFKVLSSISVLQFTNVGAIAQSVGQHIALYVDSAAPAGGLSTADYDRMRSDFDTLLYAADTAAFGRESDVDANGRVIVLMTNVVNRLVTTQQCLLSGYVAGYFFGADIDPVSAAAFNNGEIFYSMVADPAGTLSCAHSSAAVNRIIPVTFIHEFQHMISFNQHVMLRGGAAEVLWLNEGLSHYAEERGGRAFLRTGNQDRFCDHVLGDVTNFRSYLANPGGHALVNASGIGGLAERGAAWAFVRFLVDRFAVDTGLDAADALTRQLEQTSLTGTQNAAQVTGVPFPTLARQWVLANWVSDLPGFTAPPAMRYTHWAFRSYPVLAMSCGGGGTPSPFPLMANAGPGAGINVTGLIYSGSAGAYQRALQGPNGAGFSVFLVGGSGGQLPGNVVPRLNVIRIR